MGLKRDLEPGLTQAITREANELGVKITAMVADQIADWRAAGKTTGQIANVLLPKYWEVHHKNNLLAAARFGFYDISAVIDSIKTIDEVFRKATAELAS